MAAARACICADLRSAWAMHRDPAIPTSQALLSANPPMLIQKAMVEGLPAEGVLPSGQVAGVIDELLSCEDLINSIVSEAEARLTELARRANLPGS